MEANEKSKSEVDIPVSKVEKVVTVFACTWVNIICVGYALGLGVIFVPILDVFESSRAQTSLMLSLCMGVIFGGAILCGPPVRQLQPGNAIILGGLIACVGNVGASFATDVNILIITVGVINGAGLCLAHFSSYMILTAVFGRQQGLGVSALKVGSGVGGLVFPQLNVWFLDLYGWRGTFLLLSGVILNLSISGFVLRIITGKKGLEKQEETSKDPLAKRLQLHLCKRPSFLLFSLWHMPFFIFVTSQVFFLVDLATGRGFPLETSSLFLSALTFGSVFGSLLAGMLMSVVKVTGLLVTLLSCIMLAVSSVGFIYSESFVALMASSIGNGIGFGVNLPAAPVGLLQLVNIKEYPIALSFMFSLSGLGDLTSGPVGGAIYDLTDSYNYVFYLNIAVCSMMGTLTLVMEIMLRCRTDDRDNEHSHNELSPTDDYVSTETVATTL